MRHFQEVKTYSDPSYIFSGGQDPPNPPGSTPLATDLRGGELLIAASYIDPF